LTFILFDLEITIIKSTIRNTSGINTGIRFEVKSTYSIKLFNLNLILTLSFSVFK